MTGGSMGFPGPQQQPAPSRPPSFLVLPSLWAGPQERGSSATVHLRGPGQIPSSLWASVPLTIKDHCLSSSDPKGDPWRGEGRSMLPHILDLGGPLGVQPPDRWPGKALVLVQSGEPTGLPASWRRAREAGNAGVRPSGSEAARHLIFPLRKGMLGNSALHSRRSQVEA